MPGATGGGDKGTDLLPSTRIEKVIGDQHRGGPSGECEENDGEVDGGAHSGWMGDDEQVVGDIPFERAAGGFLLNFPFLFFRKLMFWVALVGTQVRVFLRVAK